ncbi:UNVERIFIED_CONTAM: hypothetical protein Scaly_1724300 [Sesamum calycinum]|uniref:Uncharacterized protein n=2 Tax=Sesamum TaxID=4181 RepID=A0AAW2NUN0_9LAMI
MVYTLPGVRLPTVPSVYKLGGNGASSHGDVRNAHLSFFLKNKSHSRKIFCGKTYESGSQSSTATASEKILVPGTENDDSTSPTEQFEAPEIVSDNPEACQHEKEYRVN